MDNLRKIDWLLARAKHPLPFYEREQMEAFTLLNATFLPGSTSLYPNSTECKLQTEEIKHDHAR